MTPLDVVKIRLQAQRTPFSKGNPAQGRAGQGAAASPLVSSLQGCLCWHSWWQGCLCSAVWGHCEVAGYCGPLVLMGSGALLGELGSCLALSFPLCSPGLRGSVAVQPPEPPAAAGCSPTASVPVSMLLPMGSAPSHGLSGLGLAPRACFGDNRNCLGSGCGGTQPPHPQSSPSAWLGAIAHTCAPAPQGVVARPPCGVSVCPHCVFQRWQCSQCPGALSRPHVSTPGAPAASGFAFPSLHPGLLLHWWWLGLLWLWGHPCRVWGLTLPPAQTAPAALLWGWLCYLCGDLLCSRPDCLWSPCLVTLSCCHIKVPLDFHLPVSLVPGQGSRAKTKRGINPVHCCIPIPAVGLGVPIPWFWPRSEPCCRVIPLLALVSGWPTLG